MRTKAINVKKKKKKAMASSELRTWPRTKEKDGGRQGIGDEGRALLLVNWVRKAPVLRIACLLLILFEWFGRRAYPPGNQSIVPFHDLSTDSSEKGRRKWRCVGEDRRFVWAIHADLLDFLAPCSRAFCGVVAGLSRARFGFLQRIFLHLSGP